eukprot:scaffold118770_cov27-Tisochrysis_lutea.AAC.1
MQVVGRNSDCSPHNVFLFAYGSLALGLHKAVATLLLGRTRAVQQVVVVAQKHILKFSPRARLWDPALCFVATTPSNLPFGSALACALLRGSGCAAL